MTAEQGSATTYKEFVGKATISEITVLPPTSPQVHFARPPHGSVSAKSNGAWQMASARISDCDIEDAKSFQLPSEPEAGPHTRYDHQFQAKLASSHREGQAWCKQHLSGKLTFDEVIFDITNEKLERIDSRCSTCYHDVLCGNSIFREQVRHFLI